MAISMYSTTVSPEKTIAEIQLRLVKNGARQINFKYDDENNLVALLFQMTFDLVPVMFCITPNIDGVLRSLENDRDVPAKYCNYQQATRVAWRIERNWIEAQLAKIESGLATPLQLLLPYAVAKDGQTFYEKVAGSKTKLLLT